MKYKVFCEYISTIKIYYYYALERTGMYDGGGIPYPFKDKNVSIWNIFLIFHLKHDRNKFKENLKV